MSASINIANRFILSILAFTVLGQGVSGQAAVTTLHALAADEGQFPHGPLVQGRDGNLYGTTSPGSSPAIAFRVSPAGNFSVINRFTPSPGLQPPTPSALMLGLDGNLYGVTTNGNVPGGVLFKMTPNGIVTELHRFGSVANDGYNIDNGILRPAPPVQTPDGTLYGTTTSGGLNGVGTVYKLSAAGVYGIIHHFTLSLTDGSNPSAPLVIGNDGNLYGTTTAGGPPTAFSGTVFRITPNGAFKLLYGFNAFDDGGHQPQAPLVKGADGIFYGTTFGSASLNQQGNIFKITPAGIYTNLNALDFVKGVADGAYPSAGLVQASDGLFYGATTRGGIPPGLFADDAGVLFDIDRLGSYNVTHVFNKSVDGARPTYSLMQHTNGKLFGTTRFSKSGLIPPGNGSIFSLDVGARPFVFAQPNSGKAGNITRLFGDFTGATGVTFNGVPATISGTDSFFRFATIPAGPATGIIRINKPAGAIGGLVNFLVQPVFSSFSPTAGAIGASVTLTGTSLSQTTAVTFSSGKKAVFTVNSDNRITAIVPTGAVTGKIGITAKGGSAVSAASFNVIP